MTTPQGPYGPPEPPPNPYAQQPRPYGYPQQPPPSPYGYPQQPGVRPGMPGVPGTPGVPGWPPQPPPRKKRTGLIAGIVVVALLAAGGIAFGVAQLVDKGADAAFPEAKYRLVVPKTVLDEEFTLSQDMSDTEGKEIEDTPDPSIRDGEAAVAQYASDEGGVLVLSGMYGRLATPGFMRGKIMQGAADAEGAEVVVPAKEFTPDGYDITVECQVVQSKEGGTATNMPMCAWGDDNTAAMIALIRPETGEQDPRAIDLEKAARETARVRAEVREPIG